MCVASDVYGIASDIVFNAPEIHNIPIANKIAESIHKGHTLNYKSQYIV